MRILYLGNNRVGRQVLRWLKEQREEIVGLVVHPPEKQKHGAEIIRESGLDAQNIFDGSILDKPESLAAIRRLRPDLALSVFFGYILKPEFIGLFRGGVINLHPAYLPYNRGTYPNVWSIVDKTPAGATLHYIDAGIDTGDIIAQQKVAVEVKDTGATLYHRLEQACLELFQRTWPLIRAGQPPRFRQPAPGTKHRARDVAQIDEIDLHRNYRAGELIDVLRARTFPPFPGAYFRSDGRKVFLRLQLLDEDELGRADDDRLD